MQKRFIFTLLFILSLALAAVAQNPQPIPKTIAKGVVNGAAVSLPKPEYPPAARAVKAGGTVEVLVTIDEQGNVISAESKGGHPLLQQAAVQAARQAKFKPTLLSGQPVKVTGIITYNFVPDASPANYEERLKWMGLGAFLAMARIESVIEDDQLLNDAPKELTEFSSELEPLKTLKNLSPDKRAKTLDNIFDSVKLKLKGAEATEFEMGKLFGDIMVEVGKTRENESYQPNETAIKNNLVKIKSLLDTLGNEFPSEVRAQFIMLTDLSDKPNLTSQENVEALSVRIMRLIETVSPGDSK